MSRAAGERLRRGGKVHLAVNMFSRMSREELRQFLARRLETQAGKSLDFSFVGFVNKRLIPVLLREAGVADPRKPAGQVTALEREAILGLLQDWRFEITGTRAWPSAQVTAGGVDVTEVDQKTMASKLVPGLFFAGEILDIDGDCGGYNLQWAWSSGYVAGEKAGARHSKN